MLEDDANWNRPEKIHDTKFLEALCPPEASST
jgi:hypothetical protein